jgi:WD40 repeat protein
LFDAQTLRLISTFAPQRGATFQLAFSADGKRLAGVVGSMDVPRMLQRRQTIQQAFTCQALTWDVATGKTLKRHPKVSALDWSADGKVMATGNLDLVVEAWDVDSGKVRVRSRPLPGLVGGMALSPSGRWLAACWQQINFAAVAARKTAPEDILTTGLVVWRLDTGAEIFAVKGGGTLAFSPDGKQLALGGLDGTIRFVDVERHQPVQALRGHAGPVNSMTFQPANKDPGRTLLASAGMDRSVRLWDPAGGGVVRTVGVHAQAVTSVRFSADGARLFSAGQDGQIKAWAASAGRGFRRLGGPFPGITNNLTFDAAGRLLAVAGLQSVHVWDVISEKEVFRVERGRCAAFAPQGTGLAVVVGREIHLLEMVGLAGVKPRGRTLRGHLGEVAFLAYRPDGKRLVAASHATGLGGTLIGDLAAWDVTTGRMVWRRWSDKPVLAVAFSPDGKHLARVSLDQSVALHDAQNGRVLRTLRRGVLLQGAYFSLAGVAFSPDGKLVAAGGGNTLDLNQPSGVTIWDSTTGRLRARFEGHTGLVSSVCFTRDGTRLASASIDLNRAMVGEIKLWDVQNGSEVLTLDGQLAAAFSPDGHLLASAGFESPTRPVIRLWDGRPPTGGNPP